MYVFTHHKNNRFQKKLIVQNTNIWISAPPPNYRASYGPGHLDRRITLQLSNVKIHHYHWLQFRNAINWHDDVPKPSPHLRSSSLQPFQQDCIVFAKTTNTITQEKSWQGCHIHRKDGNETFGYVRTGCVDLISDLCKGMIQSTSDFLCKMVLHSGWFLPEEDFSIYPLCISKPLRKALK